MLPPARARASLFGVLLLAACDQQDTAGLSATDAPPTLDAAADSDPEAAAVPSRNPGQSPSDGSVRDSAWGRPDGPSNGASGDRPASLLSLDQVCGTAATQICKRWFACAPASLAAAMGNESRCVLQLRSTCMEEAAMAGSGLTVANLALCEREVMTVACDQLLTRNGPTACFPSGTKPPGFTCGGNSHCTTGYCRLPGAQGCGVCSNRTADGGGCSNADSCMPGSLCSPAGKCVVAGARNAACDARESPCAPTLACLDKRCQPPRAAGAPCGDAAECDGLAGATCQKSPNADGKTCQVPAVATAGSPCGNVAGVATTCVGGDQLCRQDEGSARCVAPLGDGASCSAGGGGLPCMAPSTCVDGRCQSPTVGRCP